MVHDITNIWLWSGFALFLVVALAIDTFMLEDRHIRSQKSVRSILLWTLTWVALAFLFNAILWFYLYETSGLAVANQKGLEFLTGYLIEKSLSIDNLFVFYIVFHQFKIPPAYQQRVLSYGIWGAIIMRLILIVLGVWIVSQFYWVLYIMGAILLFTGIKIILLPEKEKDVRDTWVIRFISRHFRVADLIDGKKFFVRKNGLLYITPLFLALVFIEFSDLVFAFDSIPAIFAITHDPFIIWTSNIFAILGLRALYFLLANLVQRLSFLKYGVALILIFVGLKMLTEHWIHISTIWSLAVITATLSVFGIISVIRTRT